MRVRISVDKSTEFNRIVEKIEIRPYGLYSVEDNSSGTFITKILDGMDTEKGLKTFNYYFDKENTRLSAYKTTKGELFSKITNKKHISLEGNNIVPIYHKKAGGTRERNNKRGQS